MFLHIAPCSIALLSWKMIPICLSLKHTDLRYDKTHEEKYNATIIFSFETLWHTDKSYLAEV